MSQLTVASYLMGIPPGNSNQEKPKIIHNFIKGVNAVGDKGAVVTGWHAMNTDVAVIQGFVHHNSKNTRHLRLRKDVYDNQINRGKRCMIVDANLFLAYDKGNTHGYLRYSYDGIFPTTGEYCYDTPDPSRWNRMKTQLKIDVKPWNLDNGPTVLICCQRDGGWSMDGEGVVVWLVKTINEIRTYTDRQIIIRFHPGDKKVRDHVRELAKYKISKIRISSNQDIMKDFALAKCVINYNSSPAIVSTIEGIPTIQLDPMRSQAKEVVSHSLKQIETPQMFDREPWLRKLAQCHWTLDELATGEAWRHMRKWAVKE
jgi:hypothetical protein|tara:strand:+ start:369 stop:1310 length:942 start_codon:yes stop_codon:yes gene_type:complete